MNTMTEATDQITTAVETTDPNFRDTAMLRFVAALGKSVIADELLLANEAAAKAPDTTVVFDTETSGLSPQWDQILQFAAIKVGPDLEIGNAEMDVFNQRCRIRPEVVPSPQALLTTRVSPDDLDIAGLSHSELMQRVEAFLHDASPAVFAGHNVIRFDSPHLRHNMFASLLPPYPLQAAGCRLLDTLRLAQLIYVLAPYVMKFPVSANGKVSFKLGDLCEANGINLAAEDAHDALGDVRATLKLLKMMKEASPALYAYALALADKRFVTGLLERHEIIAQIGVFGGKPRAMPLAAIIEVPGNSNTVIAWDLRIDPEPYHELSVAGLKDQITRKNSPFTYIRKNASPLLIPLDLTDTMLPDCAKSLIQIDGTGDVHDAHLELRIRASIVKCDTDFQARLRAALLEIAAERATSEFVEEQLYSGGFVSDGDFVTCRKMLALPPAKRAALLTQISDPRLRTHAARIVHAVAPETLDPTERAAIDAWLIKRLTGPAPQGKWLTIPAALEAIEELRQDITESADALARQQFPDPVPVFDVDADAGARIEDFSAIEDVERERAEFTQSRIGRDLSLLDAYAAWLQAKLTAIKAA